MSHLLKYSPPKATVQAPTADEAMLEKESAIELGKKILGMATYANAMQIFVMRTHIGATRFARSKVTSATDGAKTQVSIAAYHGFKRGVADIDRCDDASLAAAVKKAEALAKMARTTDEEDHLDEQIEDIPQSTMWRQNTLSKMSPDDRAQITEQMISAVNAEKDLVSAGYLSLKASNLLVMNTANLQRYDRMTDVDCTLTVRTTDGMGSGWAGKTHRDLSHVDPKAIAREAIWWAKQSHNPVMMEPGRHQVILSATAMGQILQYFLQYALDAAQADMGMTVFSKKPRGNKWGMKVLDERLSMSSDPADPEGGYSFFSGALKQHPVTWVEKGYLRHLSYGALYGRATGHQTLPNPNSIRLDSSETRSVEDMIKDVRRGFYINRFSALSMYNMKSLLVSGTTRDGLLYIENGKIKQPAKNFRFMDSMMFFLNQMVAAGASERISVGWSPFFDFDGFLGPIIAPPVMVKDFTFTALADAV